MNMRTELRLIFMQGEKFIRIVGRIGRSVSQSFQAFKLQKLFYNGQKIWMFIHDLSEERDFFDSICKVNFSFVDDLLHRKPFFQPTSIRNDTIGTKLITATRNWDISGLIMLVHAWVDVLRDNSGIFVRKFLIIAYLIAQPLQHQRQKTSIINTEKQLNIRPFLGKRMKKWIESMVDSHNIGSISFFEFIDLFRTEADNSWLLA